MCSLLEQATESVVAIAAIGRKVGESKRPCPECRTTKLHVYSCSDAVKLEVDYCANCMGFWLDKGELDHARVLGEHEATSKTIKRNLSWQAWLVGVLLNFPAEFNVKTKRRPVVTMGLITACVLMYLLPELIGAENYLSVEQHGAFIPANFPSWEWAGELLSSQFLHGSLMHLVGNMYFLYTLGDNVEDVLGRWQYLAFYLVCGIGANLAHFGVFSGDHLGTIGASGAISGLMAAYMVFFNHARLTFPIYIVHIRLPVVVYMAVMLGFDIVGAVARNDNVAHFAHIGGFLTGWILARLLKGYVLRKNPVLRFIKPADGHRKFLALNFWGKKATAV